MRVYKRFFLVFSNINLFIATELVNFFLFNCLKKFIIQIVLGVLGFIAVFSMFNLLITINIFGLENLLEVNLLNFDRFFDWAEWFERLGIKSKTIADYYCSLLYSRNVITIKFKFTDEQREFLFLLDILFSNYASYEDIVLLFEEFGKFQTLFNSEFQHYKFLKDFYGYGEYIAPAEEDQLSYEELEEAYRLSSLKWVLKNTTSPYHSKFERLTLQPKFINVYWLLINHLTFTSLFVKGEHECAYNFYVGLCEFLVTQFFFAEMASFFIKKKILLFFFSNFVLISLMFWNLVWLCNAINLIYALLHFLFFAVLSGLLILLWGATYIAFCVLLIYAAAIPVLALYIIMLVNVDLIQRLFFIEHTTYNTRKSWVKRMIFGIIVFFCLIFSFKDFDFTFSTQVLSLNEDIAQTIFYIILAKRYINTLAFAPSIENIFDLVTSFYYSDIDKVASAAFKVSSNELVALVLLLLIAIIVVISISWTTTTDNKFLYQTTDIDFFYFTKGLTLWNNWMLWHLLWIGYSRIFLEQEQPFRAWGVWASFIHDPMFLYILRLDALDAKSEDWFDLQRLLLEPATILDPYDPWTYWFMKYETDVIYSVWKDDPMVIKLLPYGPQNRTKADDLIDEALKGILD